MEKKDSRITIRLSNSDINILTHKISEAGYKSAGAFIRDSVANMNIKPKLGPNVVTIARELIKLAAMIRNESPRSELLEQVRAIAKINNGGAL
ncbi:plasmid mobilization protein [Pseudomonas syringae]|uniref:plasmid mobilization protein n=1 Tax=Pseudomonas syringae TaxID=317 RepID=UPI003F750F25